MPAEARRLQIIEMLGKTGTGVISVAGLARLLDVSEMTIRRDLDWLEARSILTRVHGGAMAIQKDEESPFDDRLKKSNPQKIAIGWAAANLINDGERIILDAGTTTQQLARNLAGRSALTVITNNVHILIELAKSPQIETVILGGTFHHLLDPNEYGSYHATYLRFHAGFEFCPNDHKKPLGTGLENRD